MLWGRPNLDGVRSVSLGQVAGGIPRNTGLIPPRRICSLTSDRNSLPILAAKTRFNFGKPEGAEMGHRIAGVLIAIAIVFSLEWFWRVEWYVAVPLGVVGYLIVRYATYVMKERGAR